MFWYKCDFNMPESELETQATLNSSDSDSDSGSIEQVSSPTLHDPQHTSQKKRWAHPPITTVSCDPLLQHVLFDGSQAVSWSCEVTCTSSNGCIITLHRAPLLTNARGRSRLRCLGWSLLVWTSGWALPCELRYQLEKWWFEPDGQHSYSTLSRAQSSGPRGFHLYKAFGSGIWTDPLPGYAIAFTFCLGINIILDFQCTRALSLPQDGIYCGHDKCAIFAG